MLVMALHPPQAVELVLLFLLGAGIGTLANLWAIRLVEGEDDSFDPTNPTASARRTPGHQPVANGRSPWWHFLPLAGYALAGGGAVYRGRAIGRSGLAAEIGTGLLFVIYVLAAVSFNAHDLAEVQPDDFWRQARLAYHLVLISFLVAATATDLRAYLIPDAITLPGIVIGVALAALAGQLQLIHVWVDWNQEVPGVRGPYLPEWLDAHRHLHGLAWSVAGVVAGGGITWLARILSRWILGREALGLGDVTLMALIGSYLGWQPTILVFFLAPLAGLAAALAGVVLARRTWLPYGPCLSAAAFVVLCGWKWLWRPMRTTFGDAALLVLLSVAALAAFVALLWCIRRIQLVDARGGENDAENSAADTRSTGDESSPAND